MSSHYPRKYDSSERVGTILCSDPKNDEVETVEK